MRQNPSFALTDTAEMRRIIEENPWAVLVSDTSTGLVASHYPVVLDPTREDLTVVTHVGRPDEQLHELGDHELLIVIQGPHGYISSSWYDEKPAVPTWNFAVVHLSGVPELLEPAENLHVLENLVDHFERRMPEPRQLFGTVPDAEYAERISVGTVGVRLTPTRVTGKLKMSQNRPAPIVDNIIAQLDGDGPYSSAGLANEMKRVRDRMRPRPDATC